MAAKPDKPVLSPSEWEVMKTFWDYGNQAARDVHARLEEKDWSIKTVKTMLARMVAKGALDYMQVGNAYLYHAVYTREELTAEEMRGFVDRVLDGQSAPAMTHFIRETRLDESQIRELRALLDEKEREISKGKEKRK